MDTIELKQEVGLELTFAGSYLPILSEMANAIREDLKPVVGVFKPFRWFYTDKVLAALAPEFWRDITDFYESEGPDMMELLGPGKVAEWDGWLCQRLRGLAANLKIACPSAGPLNFVTNFAEETSGTALLKGVSDVYVRAGLNDIARSAGLTEKFLANMTAGCLLNEGIKYHPPEEWAVGRPFLFVSITINATEEWSAYWFSCDFYQNIRLEKDLSIPAGPSRTWSTGRLQLATRETAWLHFVLLVHVCISEFAAALKSANPRK